MSPRMFPDPARLRDAAAHLSAADDLLSAEIKRADSEARGRLKEIGKRLLAARSMMALAGVEVVEDVQ